MSCGTEGSASPDGGAALKTTTVGGQNIFVTLASTMDNPLDDGSDGDTGNDDGTVRAFVTVKNLLVQPMATTNSDGSALADSDLKVFFETGPTGTGGSVSVANEDGTGTFTASGQKFFQFDQGGSASAGSDTDDYTGTLATDETTNAQTEPWEFTHDVGVTAFQFTVFVTVDLPHENSVYRSADRNTGTVGSKNLRGLWGASADEAWVAAGDGTILHTTDGGANWTDQSSGTSNRLNALWGASGSELWAAGDVQSDWFDTDWPNRKKITVQSSEVGANLTDFPVYVDLADLGTSFFGAVQSDGADIRVTAADGTTELPREVVSIDTGAESGELHFEAPSLSGSSNTEFWVYYGNSSASAPATTDPNGRNAVWANGYEGVWHLEESSGTHVDATGNGHGGTTTGGTYGVAGKLGSARDNGAYHDGAQVDVGDIDLGSALTVSGWSFIDQGDNSRILEKWDGTGDEAVRINPNDDGTGAADYRVTNDGGTRFSDNPTGVYTTGVWTHFAMTWDGSTVTGYADGSQVTTGSLSGTLKNTTSSFLLGNSSTEARSIDGKLDEFRVQSVSRSSAWVTTEHNNQNSPGTFYSVGSEESAEGTILSTSDGGTNWGSQTSGVGRDVRDVFGVSTSDVWAVGNNGVVTHFNGTSWSTQTSNTTSDLHGVWAANSSDVWAVGAGGEIRRTLDGGTSWGSETSPVATALNDVWGAGTDDVWAVGAGGVLIHRSGGSWSEDSQSGSLTTENLLSVFGNGASDVFAVGANGTLLHYDGTDWMVMTSRAGSTTELRGVWGHDATNAWIAGDGGAVRQLDRDTS